MSGTRLFGDLLALGWPPVMVLLRALVARSGWGGWRRVMARWLDWWLTGCLATVIVGWATGNWPEVMISVAMAAAGVAFWMWRKRAPAAPAVPAGTSRRP